MWLPLTVTAMLQMIDEGRALDIVSKYFMLAESTGYVRQDLMTRFFLYVFLLDFIDYTHGFFSEYDYKMIDTALRKLFSGGGCLLPYTVFCANRVTLGRNEYMGVLRNRITEDLSGNEDRFTQDDNIRTV